MKVSVVMAAFNESKHIASQLRALAAQEYAGDWEVIVADNGSTDGTPALAEGWSNRLPIRVVDAAARRGCGAARNIGVQAATGEAVLFCDGDDVVAPGWLPAHAAALRSADVSGGVISRFSVEPLDDPPRPRALPTLLGWLPYAPGGNCGVRRTVYDAVGGFNESNPFAEDVEFSWRAQLAGFSLGYAPDAIVYVRTRATAKQMFVQSYRYGKCDVDLFRRYQAYGASRASPRRTLRTYGGLVARLPALKSGAVRERWLHQAGRRAGRLVASIEERTFFP
jgi:glycosyltransferase involved in cell wall biosynthesis